MPTREESGKRLVMMMVPDLFFTARISAAAGALGVRLENLDPVRAVDQCRDTSPDLVIMDLGGTGDPLGVTRALKSEGRTRQVRVVGYYSHVDQALRDRALQAGVDQVLPRSTFSGRLGEILTSGAIATS